MNISLGEAANALSRAKKIVITAHVNPDGDAIGSSLGLRLVLLAMEKEVQVFIDDDIPAIFSILPGYEVIEKPGTAEGKENTKADLLVILDASPDRIGAVGEVVDAPVLNIDHHVTNGGEEIPSYVDPGRAATAEIIYELMKEMGQPVTRDIATCIFTGIATDTGFFRYSNTSPFTLRTAAALIEHGAQPHIVSEAMEQKSYDSVMGMAAAVQTTERFSGGRAVGIFLDLAATSSIENTEGAIDMVRTIEGVDVAVLLKCKEEKLCRVSMRSKGLDVAKIAASFGGGGHVRAAGCTLEMDFEAAKKAIMTAIDSALETEA